jgi:deoxyhypusine synthase
VDELVLQMDAAWGFTAGKLATGVSIMEDMVNAKGCVKFLSFTADIVATGTRGVIRELVKRKLVDVIITTCGTLDHDVARCFKDYYKGSFIMNDSKLHQEGVNRLGNVLVTKDSYGIIIEQKIIGLLEELYKEGKKEFQPANSAEKSGYAAVMKPRFCIGLPKITFPFSYQA